MEGKSHNAKLCESVRDGEENPFWTIEAAQEHINMVFGFLHRDGYDISRRNYVGETVGKMDSVEYQLCVVEGCVQRAFEVFAAIIPDLYAASDGDMQALQRIKAQLTTTAAEHQRKWDAL